MTTDAAPDLETDEGEPPLAFDAWATLSARMVRRTPEQREAILREAGVDDETWARCDAHWSAAIVDDVVSGRLDRRALYGKRCADELAGRVQPAPTAPAPVEAPKEPPLDDPPVASPEAPRPLQTPSYARASMNTAGVEPGRTAEPARVEPPRSSLAGTSLALDVPRRPATPFVAPQGAEPQIPSGPARGQRDRPHSPAPPALTGTSLSVDGPRLPVIPFASPGKPAAASPEAPPALSLEQYASLHAELQMQPHRAAEVLRKYTVNDEDARRALDAAWHARWAAHPEERRAWERLVATYTEWLRRSNPP